MVCLYAVRRLECSSSLEDLDARTIMSEVHTVEIGKSLKSIIALHTSQ